MKQPIVYDFTDYREYLQKLIDYKRQLGTFSYAQFAERAGFQSRSYLRTVITGKRNLSNEALTKIVVGFGLSFQEGESFKALAQFNQSKNFEERKYYWESFLNSCPKKVGIQKVQDEYKYLARMFYPILLIILRQQHIKKTTQELARLVGASQKEVNEGLETLTNLGLVSKTTDENGLDHYIASATPVNTSNDIPNIAIQTFHSNMLDTAKKALALSPRDREFQTQVIALSEDDMNYIKTRVRSLMDEICEKFDRPRVQSEKVYALNLNLIPVTPEFIRKEASQNLVESDQNEEKIS